jgi:membrane protease YdiL (CAAX protease family)
LINDRRQLTVFLILLALYALSAFITYTLFVDRLALSAGVPMPEMNVPPVLLGLANAGIVLVLYGLLGLAGYWFARRLGLPGIFSPDGNLRRWILIPLAIGVGCGIALILLDFLFAPVNGFGRMIHPQFPVSIFASISAGIGEEIAFRGFVFGLWAILLNWFLQRWNVRGAVLWIANVLAALAFGAGHLGTVMFLTGAATLGDLNPVLLVEIFLLNGFIGIVAGQRYMRDGLIAAAGVHFWTDMVWHVLSGL